LNDRLIPRLRISGTIELPVYAFMEWTGTTTLYYHFCEGVVQLIKKLILWMLIAKRINVDCEEYTVSALLYHNTQNITVV
jgi:hypothetical protein